MNNTSASKQRFPAKQRACCGFGNGALLGLTAIVVAWAAGCRNNQSEHTEAKRAVGGVPVVHIVKPELRTIDYAVDNPGFVDAYEQTSIYSKVSGFIKHFYVDIGSEVKKGELLAEISVPELDEDHQRKMAQVGLDKRLVEQAQQLVVVAQSNVQNAIAQVAEAKADVGRYQAAVVRWESELKRLTQVAKEDAIDQQVIGETKKQFDSAIAERDSAKAAVAAREADQATAEANLGKARIDIETAQAKVQVSEADERMAAAMLSYTKLTAPYDGVITVRNANTGDYVQSVTGDKSTTNPSAIFVVARLDILRIFVDVPEEYVRYVQKGTKALVRAEALSGLQIPATVTRTSWSLHERTRALRVEVDLSAQDYDGLRPGMYVYLKVLIERSNVYALPQQTLTVSGNQTYCYLLHGSTAVMTSVEPGISDGRWVEIDRMKIDDPWIKVTDKENVIEGNLSELTNGQTVKVQGSTSASASP